MDQTQHSTARPYDENRRDICARSYAKHRVAISERRIARVGEWLRDAAAREACIQDPRKIRDVAGDDRIVCPGTPQSWCGRLFPALKGPHLKEHYPNSDHPAIELRKDWELPKTFSLMSKNASARNAASIKVHPFTDPAVARAAGMKGGKSGGKQRRLAVQNIIDSGAHKGPRPGGRHPVPKKQKFSEGQLRKLFDDGLTLVEIADLKG